MSLRVRLAADRGFSSGLIEWWGGGFFSHFATFVSASEVIDARSDVIDGIAPGVKRRPVSYLDQYPCWVDLDIPCDAAQFYVVVSELESQLDKPYDRAGIEDFLTGSLRDRNWRDQSAWFCDELAAWAMERGAIIKTLMLPLYRLTPGTVGMVCQQAGGRAIASKGMPFKV